VGSAFDPPLPVVIGLWVLSGLCCAYQVPANAAFVAAVADAHRGQAFGLAVTALRATQGVGVLVAGVLAQASSPAGAVALSGAVGVVAALAAGGAWRRARQAVADDGEAGRTPGPPGPTTGTPDAA
jgi:MFS family permease